MHEPNDPTNKPPDPEAARSPLSSGKLSGVLSNATRLEILGELATARRSVTEIARALNLDQPAVSRALRILADAGLVRYESMKKHHFYELTGAIRITRRGPMLYLKVRASDGELAMKTKIRAR